MGVLRYLFSFNGRINRAKLWVWAGVCFVLQLASLGIAFAWPMYLRVGHAPDLSVPGFAMLPAESWLVYVALLWPTAALSVKRLHDRDKSAVWLLLFWGVPFGIDLAVFAFPGLSPVSGLAAIGWLFAPLGVVGVVVAIWAFLELYCFSGTFGKNRFGPDPLGGQPDFSCVFPEEKPSIDQRQN